MFDAEGVIIMFIIIFLYVHAEHANGKDKCN